MAAGTAVAPTSPMSKPALRSNKDYSKIFRPPSQSTTPISKPSTTSNDYFSATGSRKRSRADSSMDKSMYTSTDVFAPAWLSNARSPSDDGACSIFSTESLVVNDRYRLAGGYDTPALLATGDLDTSVDLDIYARRTIKEAPPRLHITDPTFAGPLARERNGYARTQQQPSSPSWTKLAFTFPLSIAGKVFSFGSTVLKGFYAGQGQGFELEGSKSKYTTPRWQSDLATPVPGQWYEPPHLDAAFEGDFEQDNTPTGSAQPPPAKRRTTDKDWVVVDAAEVDTAPEPASPKKRPSSATPRVGRPRASSRRSFMTHSRRQSHNNNNNSPSALTPQQPHITLPRQSMPGSPTRQSPGMNAAFPSPDAERFARRQAKQERAADRTMNSMSRQLEELIRQGQAALGTKFTVEDNDLDEDEGFVDEY